MFENKKILYILNAADKVNNFSHSSMIAAQKQGITFHIAANWSYASAEDREADAEKYGIKIHQIDFIRSPYNLGNIKAYKQLLQLITEEKYDGIHCNTPMGGFLGRLVAKKCGVKKVIYQAHGFHFYKGAPKMNWLLYYHVEKWLAHYTDALITINQEDFKIAQTFKLRNNGKVYYVPGVGVDLNLFAIQNKEDIACAKREELGVCETDTVLLSAGRLDANKNNLSIIKAVKYLNDNSVHLVVCGDGKEMDMLKKAANELGISNQIHFLGQCSDMPVLYRMADIFVLASYREGLSRSIMEAMASGLPVACSRIRGNTELIDDGKGGILFDPANVDDIVNSVNKLFSSDIQAMRQYNLDKIHNFRLDTVIQKMMEVYSSEFLCKTKQGAAFK